VTGYARTLGGSAGWFIGGSSPANSGTTTAPPLVSRLAHPRAPTKLYRRSSKQSFVYYFLVILGALVS